MCMKRLKLAPEWRNIMHRAWSMRLGALAAVLSGVEVVLPLFANEVPRNLFAALSFVAVIGAMVARVVAQPKMHNEP